MTTTTSTKPQRSAVDPARLHKFIDSPSATNATRVQHAAEIKAQTKVVSWNGDKCDTRAFDSRLAPSDTVLVATDRRAQRLLGTSGGVPPSGLLASKHVPVARASAATEDRLSAPLMVQRDGVGHGPQIAHVAVPSSVFLHEQGLLTPAQRRERLQFETTYHAARRAMEQAEKDERRLHQIVHARHATNDVLNTEPLASAHVERGAPRGEPFKPQLLHHDVHATPTLPREFQKKAEVAMPHVETHARLFNETPVPWKPERAQHLRNQGQGGRPFDIVNGGVVPHFAPTIREKQHPRQSHPSVIVHPYTR